MWPWSSWCAYGPCHIPLRVYTACRGWMPDSSMLRCIYSQEAFADDFRPRISEGDACTKGYIFPQDIEAISMVRIGPSHSRTPTLRN